jgi:wyosine [tRNA(Phe)-imidazoG37] synthetase (radical SAM superfamily)
MSSKLSINNHSVDIAGLKYIYPVISRRAGGLSIGVNFNTDNSCNWRCIYCQVPGLKVGVAPPIDLNLLESELRYFLSQVIHGDFYQRYNVAQANREIKDIAIAGNGEPTTLKEFASAVTLIGEVAAELQIFPQSKYVLITNGSLIHQPRVQEGLRQLHAFGGEVWFKLDSATEEGKRFINNAGQSRVASLDNLMISDRLCQTKLQICLFDYDNQGFSAREKTAFIQQLKTIKAVSSIVCVMLYTIARPSLQPESGKLKKMSAETMNAFADEVKSLGFNVSISL